MWPSETSKKLGTCAVEVAFEQPGQRLQPCAPTWGRLDTSQPSSLAPPHLLAESDLQLVFPTKSGTMSIWSAFMRARTYAALSWRWPSALDFSALLPVLPGRKSAQSMAHRRA